MQLAVKVRQGVESLSERTSLSLLTACLIYLSLLAAGEKQLNDSDTLWHIVLGRRILDTWRLPQADAFSFTFDGAPYQTNSWLSDVLLAAAYDIGGFAGVITLSTFCVSLTFFLLQREYLSSLSNKFSIYFCCAVFVLLAPHILSRPHVLVFPLVALWAIFVLRAEAENRAPPLVALVVLFFWANMHGSFLLAFVVTGPIFLLGVFRDRGLDREKLRSWGVFLAGMAAVAVIGPYGLGPLKTAFSVLSVGPLLSSIQEWRPESFASFGRFEAILLLTIGMLAYGGVRLSLARTVIFLGLLHMALSHTRNTDYLAIIGSILLAAPVAAAMGSRDLYINSRRALPFVAAATLAAALATVFLRNVAPPASAYPANALQAARQSGARGNVLNQYGFSGALIFDGAKVFIDSRAEFYPKDFLETYLSFMDKPDVETVGALVSKYDIGWSIFSPSDPVAAVMGRLPGWREAYRDDVAVVHVRSDRPQNEP